jgi:hypothetical protein
MAIDVTIGTSLRANADSYTVVEDSTPLDPSDSSGGIGQFTVTIPESADAKHLSGLAVTLVDGTQGVTVGVSSGLTGDGQTLTLTVDGRLNAFMATLTAQPYSGTLGGAFAYYCSLVGITTGLLIDSTITARAVSYPGFTGVIWTFIKQICVAQQVEVSLISNNIVLRPIRTRIAQNYRDSKETWALDKSNLAQQVQIYQYGHTQAANAPIYPLGGPSLMTPILQVDAGQTLSFDIALNPGSSSTGLGVSLTSLTQPTCVLGVASGDISASQFSAIGSDGLPISVADWTNNGGSVTAKINADTTSMTIKLTGPSKLGLSAPFRLAAPDGTGNVYSTLRLRGGGVFFNKQLLTFMTGAPAATTPTVVGATVDNPAISTMADAYSAALVLLARYGSPRQNLTVATRGINRLGDTGSYAYPTFSAFDAAAAGQTFGTFDTANAGQTFGQFDAAQFATVSTLFANQAFGNVGGARVLNDNQWYRIRSVSAITPAGANYVAERDTTIGDFDTAFAGMTFGQFDALYPGKTFLDFDVQPLRTS